MLTSLERQVGGGCQQFLYFPNLSIKKFLENVNGIDRWSKRKISSHCSPLSDKEQWPSSWEPINFEIDHQELIKIKIGDEVIEEILCRSEFLKRCGLSQTLFHTLSALGSCSQRPQFSNKIVQLWLFTPRLLKMQLLKISNFCMEILFIIDN